jgi:hypothetical protein
MVAEEFIRIRKQLDKTQQEMAQLLGGSVKAVRSYEQGWRSIPAHAERQMLFLLFLKEGDWKWERPCWEVLSCPEDLKPQCPAWEFRAGILCWFINGTICSGCVQNNWAEKIQLCRGCPAFPSILKKALNE